MTKLSPSKKCSIKVAARYLSHLPTNKLAFICGPTINGLTVRLSSSWWTIDKIFFVLSDAISPSVFEMASVGCGQPGLLKPNSPTRVSCHSLPGLALTPAPKRPLVESGRAHHHVMTGLIFTQGRGIQLSAACLGHQPRLEQAGKSVQAGAGWCRYGAGATRECQGATKALKPRQPKATAAVSHHTPTPPLPLALKLWRIALSTVFVR